MPRKRKKRGSFRRLLMLESNINKELRKEIMELAQKIELLERIYTKESK